MSSINYEVSAVKTNVEAHQMSVGEQYPIDIDIYDQQRIDVWISFFYGK